MISIIWLIAFIILIGIEISTMALTTIWFAGGALAAFLLSLLGLGVELQLVVFVSVSFVLLFFTRPWAARHLNNHTVKTNAESLIGKAARITATVNNELGTGSAMIGGQEWTARAQANEDIYLVGTMVTIKEIRGVKLIVKREQGED